MHGPEGPNPRLGSTKSNEGMWSGTLDPPPSSPAQTFPVEASEVENSKHIPKGTGSPDVFASSDSEVDVSYSTFKDEINVSHLKIKGKHLTKEQVSHLVILCLCVERPCVCLFIPGLC